MTSSVFLCVCLCLGAHLVRAALPPGWKACTTKDSKYSTCLSNAIQTAVSSLKAGNKKLGVPPLEPLVFKKMVIDQSQGAVPIRLEFTNIAFRGLTKAKFTPVSNDWKEMKFKLFCDRVENKGKYKINGKVLILPISGEGDSSILWHNVTVGVRIVFKDTERKGKHYLEAKEFHTDLDPKLVNVRFDNLFNGDKALAHSGPSLSGSATVPASHSGPSLSGSARVPESIELPRGHMRPAPAGERDNMNLFLNENWKEITDELKPAMSNALNQAVIQIANQIFSRIPRNELDV